MYSTYIDLVKHYVNIGLQSVPERFRDYNMCITAVKQYGYALKYVPTELPEYKDICMAAVKQDGTALVFVLPEELRDYNMCITAVKQNSNAFDSVPPELQPRIREELGL
jgi:hypothetical protein